MAPRRETVVSIFTGIISNIIAYIQLNIAMLTCQANYERMRATLVRLLSILVARNVAGKRLDKRRQARRRKFLVRPGGTNVRSTGFVNQIVVPEEWRQNFRMSQVPLLIIYNGACSVSKSSVFVPFLRIRVDARKRNESEYVWTRKVLNPQQNVCRYQRLRIRVDVSIVFKFVAMFIGVCGNIAVIILTRTSKFWNKEKTETSYLVRNLALADLLMCLTWIVEFTLTILDSESDQLLFFKFSRSFAYSLLFASVASLLAITVERYIYIIKSLKYPLIVTRRRVFTGISAIWLTSCCIFALQYVYFEIYDTELRSICFISDCINYPLDTFQTYIPVFLIVFLNLRILFVSRQQRKKILVANIAGAE